MKFYREHTWINEENNTVGISEYAQQSLGDIVFIELPQAGQEFNKGEQFGSVESVKSVSALFAPVSIRIVEVNENLEDEPEIINSDPYNAGWIAKVEIIEETQLGELMNEEDYLKYLAE